MKMTEILQPDNVAIDLIAPSKLRLLQIISEQAAQATGSSEKAIFEALRNREKLGSTGIGEGVALPHAPVAEVTTPFTMLVRLRKAIDFDAIDDIPVDIVFLLLTPTIGHTAHLNILSFVARRMRLPGVLKKLRNSAEKEQLYSAVTDEVE